jgi:WD40 repeat protein
MLRVLLKPRNGKTPDESSNSDENPVMFPEDFTTKELNDYINSLLKGNKEDKNYSFYYQNNKIFQQPLKFLLAEYEASNEELMLIEYKPTDRVDLVTANTFPDWIRCILAVNKNDVVHAPTFYSGGFDGVLRRGKEENLCEFKSAIIDLKVLTSNSRGYYVLACTRDDLLLFFPNGTHKLKSLGLHNLSCANTSHCDSDGVIYFYTGHEDGTLQGWRFTKTKGFLATKGLKFDSRIIGILFPSKNDSFVFTETTIYHNGELVINSKRSFDSFDVKQSSDGKYLVAIGHPNGVIDLYKNSHPYRKFKIDSEIKWVSGVKFFSKFGDQDPRMAVIGHDGILRIYDCLDGSLLHKIPVCPLKKLLALDVLENFVYVGGEECIVKVYQINS